MKKRDVNVAVVIGAVVLLAQVLVPQTLAYAATGLPHDKTPSDANIAVGPDHIVEVVNSQIGVWVKTNLNAPIVAQSIQSFLGTAPGVNDCGDPIVLYLPVSQRWAFSCTENSGVSLAVSMTADPTGAWFRWIRQPQTGLPFLDAPKLLITTDKLAVYGGSGTGDATFVYPLASVLAGTLPTPVRINAAENISRKAAVYQNAASVKADGYFVGNGCIALGCGFHLLRLSGPPTSPTITPVFIGADTAPGLATAQPPIPGGSVDAHLFGKGVIAAVMEDRTSDGHTVIAFSGQQGCPTDANRYCTYRNVYDLTTNQLVRGLSGQPTVEDHTLGSVGIDAAGNLFHAYLSSSAGKVPSAGAAGPGWFATIAAGTGASGVVNERWGDYYNVAQDPADGSRVWFVSAYQTGVNEFDWGSAFGCGTAASFSCGGTPTGGPKAQHRNFDANPADNTMKPGLQLVNNTSAAVQLSTVKMRYWFTRDGGANTFGTACDFAQMGCANITRTVVNLATPRTGADAYLEVGFTAGAGQLPVNASTGEMQLRLNKTDFSNLTETNDYSYTTNTSFIDSTKVTVYVNTQLVWGTEP